MPSPPCPGADPLLPRGVGRAVLFALPLLGLLPACQPGRTDVSRYVQAATAPDYPQARRLCATIGQVELRAQCAMDLARLYSADHPAETAADCADLPPSAWRDECHFFVAEGLGGQQRLEDAARVCHQSGAFAASCVMHLWAMQARALLPDMGADSQAADPRPAIQSFSACLGWAALAGLDLDRALQERAWSQFFQVAHQQRDPLDLAACRSLEGSDARRCRSGAVILLNQRFNQRSMAMTVQQHDHACLQLQQLPPAQAAARFGVRYLAGPVLDAAATLALKRTCASATGYAPPPNGAL